MSQVPPVILKTNKWECLAGPDRVQLLQYSFPRLEDEATNHQSATKPTLDTEMTGEQHVH